MFRSAPVLAVLGSGSLLGCGAGAVSGPVPSTAVASAAPDDDLTMDLNDHRRHHHQGGVTMLVALSLDTLGLPPERQALVTKIQSDLFARMEPSRARQQEILTALADGMAAGSIDKAKVDAAIAELGSASALVYEATVGALDQLHAALTPPERAALADKVWAQWGVFQEANSGGDALGVGKERPLRQLTELATELALSADQVEKIRASFLEKMSAAAGGVDRSDIDVHLRRLGEFRGDAFDARTLPGGAVANAHLAVRGATRMACFYEAASPLLTPDQRAKLVDSLREHATHVDAAAIAAP
jgi:Spy/CpxP family protein refolding chaperone